MVIPLMSYWIYLITDLVAQGKNDKENHTITKEKEAIFIYAA